MANQQWVMKEPGVGFTKNPFVNFSIRTFMILQKYMLYFLNHIYIWQVSPELSCGNTCQILMWYSTANICCDNAENNRTEDNWLRCPPPPPPPPPPPKLVLKISAMEPWCICLKIFCIEWYMSLCLFNILGIIDQVFCDENGQVNACVWLYRGYPSNFVSLYSHWELLLE